MSAVIAPPPAIVVGSDDTRLVEGVDRVVVSPKEESIWREEFIPHESTPDSWLYTEYSERHPQIREIATFLKALFGHYPPECGYIELRCFQRRGKRNGSVCYRRWYPIDTIHNLTRKGGCDENIEGIIAWYDAAAKSGDLYKPDVSKRGSPYKRPNLFEMAKDIALRSREYDVYIGVLPRSEAGIGDANGVRAAGCLWADLDCKNGMTDILCLQAAKDADIVVKSGTPGNLQGYWISKTIVPMNIHTRKPFLQRLLLHQRSIHAADTTADLPRLMRCCGTWNHKGEVSHPVRLMRYPR